MLRSIPIKTLSVYLSVFLVIFPFNSFADEEVQRFKTLADRREAGINHNITEWLSVTPSIELESELTEFDLIDANNFQLRERNKSVQIGFEVQATDWLNAEVVYEYDDQLDELVLEEVIVELELDEFKLEAGKLYLPFGEYYSRFVTGPLLEFTETRARAIVFAYEPETPLEASVYIFKSKLNDNVQDEGELDWGLSFDFTFEGGFSIGVGYLSDLSESEEMLLEDTRFYLQQVDAVSVYSNIEFDDYEVSIEYMQALGHFTELDTASDKPGAWNIELGIYPEGSFDWALRIEGSHKLEEVPEYQFGINNTWRVNKYLSASVDYLYGRFKEGFVEDDDGNEIKHQNKVAAQLIISF